MRLPASEPATTDGDAVSAMLDALRQRLEADRPTNIGFPSTFDFEYAALYPFFGLLMNNVGDPYKSSAFPANCKDLERDVVEWAANLFRAPESDRWGYVTTGGSEGNLYALHLARNLFPGPVVYFSDAAHYSVDKAIGLLGLASVRVRTDQWGEIDYNDLTSQIDRRRDRPAIVVATAGTTMTEAVDDVRRIVAILDDLAVRNRFVHVDAALAGIPLALLDPTQRPGLDFADGADSIAVSGHKFLGSPFPERPCRRQGVPPQPHRTRHQRHGQPRRHDYRISIRPRGARVVVRHPDPWPRRSSEASRHRPHRGRPREVSPRRTRLGRLPPPARLHRRPADTARTRATQVGLRQRRRMEPPRRYARGQPDRRRRARRRHLAGNYDNRASRAGDHRCPFAATNSDESHWTRADRRPTVMTPTDEYQEPPDDAIARPLPPVTVPEAIIARTLETLNLLDEFFRLHSTAAVRAELRHFAGLQGWDPIQGAELLIEGIGLDARGLTRAREPQSEPTGLDPRLSGTEVRNGGRA